MTEVNIAIIGTGALACLFGARLSKVANVVLVGSWREQLNAINAHGLSVNEMTGSKKTFKLKAALFPEDIPSIPKADYALVLVKSYQTAEAAQRIKRIIKPNGVVLSLQNGLGNQEKLLQALPFHMVSSGITMQGANVVRLGVVNHAGNGVSVIDDKPFLTRLNKLMRQADLPIQTYKEYGVRGIQAVIWQKLIINASINPLTAILGVPNGFLAENPNARELCIETVREAFAVGELDGGLPSDQFEETIGIKVAQQTAENRSSMLQDVTNGRKTEIDSICGEIVRRSTSNGLKTPLNTLWLKLISEYERTGKQPKYSVEELLEMIRHRDHQ
ncbi:MAG: 2-dehydropantoate 2-reductase [Chloroflexota bacterium]